MSRPSKSSSIIPITFSGDPFDKWEPLREAQIGLQNSRHELVSAQGVMFSGVSGLGERISPLAGWEGNAPDTTISDPYEVPIEIPSGLTSWSLLIHINLEDNGAQVGDVEFKLFDPDLGASQVLVRTYASGGAGPPVNLNVGAGDQHLSYTGLIGPSFNPAAGEVMEASLIITPNMTVPSLPSGQGSQYWTGCLQCVLIGY